MLKDTHGLSAVFAGCTWLTLFSAGLAFIGYRFFAARDLARYAERAASAELQATH
jgi:hypothetical protein